MSTPKGFGPQRPHGKRAGIEVYTPPVKERPLHPHEKRVVDKTVYRQPAFQPTPAEEALRNERIKAAGGFTVEDLAAWQDQTRKMKFKCQGTDVPITRFDLLCMGHDQIGAIAYEASEARKRIGAVVDDMEARLERAESPVEQESLQKGIRGQRYVLSVYAAFDWSCDFIKNCSRAAMEVARERDAEALSYIARIKQENKELKEAVLKLKNKAAAKQAVAIPAMPAPSAEPRSIPELNAMYQSLGDGVLDYWSAEEYNSFLDACRAEDNYYQDAAVDWSIAEDQLKKHEREVAAERIANAAYDAECSRKEYERLRAMFSTEPPAPALEPSTRSTDVETFDAEHRRRIRHQVETFLAKQQKAENRVDVQSSHAALKACFDSAAAQGEWEYLPDDHDMCKTGQQTRFADQLSHVLTRMVEDKDLKRVAKFRHDIIALRLF